MKNNHPILKKIAVGTLSLAMLITPTLSLTGCSNDDAVTELKQSIETLSTADQIAALENKLSTLSDADEIAEMIDMAALDEIRKDELRHGAAADVAVADKKYSFHQIYLFISVYNCA